MTKAPAKKTIYVDVDEEITSIIDKLRTAREQIVALVLPKRATMLQSIVNMKLLKRAADQEGKKAVLITSESSLMPLAGAAGLHVAHNLQSRPFLPPVPSASDQTNIVSAKTNAEDTSIDPQTPIGVAAGLDKEESVEIDNRPKEPAAVAAAAGSKAKAAKGKSKFKIPNFNKFRLKLIIGGALLLLLLVGLWWALAAAPKAKVTIKGDTNDIPLSVGFTADTDAENLDTEQGIMPARQLELKKTASEKAPATGQKDKGTKAGGVMTLKNCTDNKATIPAGTGVSSGSFTYITQSTVKLDDGEFTSGGQCKSSGDHVKTTNVIAQNNGEQYNAGPRSYTVAGFSGVSASGEAMTGGTSNIVKVISQGDIEAAQQKLAEQQAKGREELKNQLEDTDYWAIIETFAEIDPKLAPNPAVDAEANEVTVTLDVTYTMLGVRKDDLEKLVEHAAKQQVDTAKQSILSEGLDNAAFEVGEVSEPTTRMTMKTTIVAGPEVDQKAIKSEIAGKKRGEAEQLLSTKTGYKEVRIDLSPFWVYSVPKKEAKINIVVEQNNGQELTQ